MVLHNPIAKKDPLITLMADYGSAAGDERGVSEVLGFALLIGMVSIGALLVVVYGSASIEQVQDQTDKRTVEIALQEVDSQLTSLSNQADVTQVEFEMANLNPGRVDIIRAGHVNITVNQNKTCSLGASYPSRDGVPLTSIRYETQDETVIAYEAGGVFRQERSNRSSTVTSPDADVQNGVIQLQLLNLTGEIDESRNTAFLNVSSSSRETDRLNDQLFQGECVRPDNVTLQVQSTFFRAWGDYFEEQTDRPVQTYENNQTVQVFFGQQDLPEATNDELNRVVNLSASASYMNEVNVTAENISISKNATTSYRVSTRPIGNGSTSIANKTTFKTADLGNSNPTDVVYVLDTSGSMSGTKITDAKQAAIDSLSVLNTTDRAGVVEYNSRADMLTSGGQFLTNTLRGPNSVESTINGLSAGGGTCINCGIRKALDMYATSSNQTRNKTIILLSDGRNDVSWESTPNMNSRTRDMARRAAAQNVTIYAAGFGTQADVNECLLGGRGVSCSQPGITNITGGEYNFSSSPDELRQFFRDSATNIVEQERITNVPLTVNATRNNAVQPPFIAGNDEDIARIRNGGRAFPNVNDPTAPSQFQQTFIVRNGDSVELNATYTACEEYETVPLTAGGTPVARCANVSNADLIGPDHIGVYRDGYDAEQGPRPLLTDNSPSWDDTMYEKLESENLLDSNNHTQLESNQVLVVFNFSVESGHDWDWNRMPVLYEVGLSEGEARPPVGYLQIRDVRIEDES